MFSLYPVHGHVGVDRKRGNHSIEVRPPALKIMKAPTGHIFGAPGGLSTSK